MPSVIIREYKNPVKDIKQVPIFCDVQVIIPVLCWYSLDRIEQMFLICFMNAFSNHFITNPSLFTYYLLSSTHYVLPRHLVVPRLSRGAILWVRSSGTTTRPIRPSPSFCTNSPFPPLYSSLFPVLCHIFHTSFVPLFIQEEQILDNLPFGDLFSTVDNFPYRVIRSSFVFSEERILPLEPLVHLVLLAFMAVPVSLANLPRFPIRQFR